MTKTEAERRCVRLDRLLDEYKEKAKTLRYMNIPIDDLTREELLALLAYQSESIVKLIS